MHASATIFRAEEELHLARWRRELGAVPADMPALCRQLQEWITAAEDVMAGRLARQLPPR